MASVALESFMPDVLTESPSAPYPLIMGAIRQSCFEFCRDSLWWNDIQDDNSYEIGEAEYEISAPSQAQVAMVLSVVVDGALTLIPKTIDSVSANRPDWRTRRGAIECYIQTYPSTIRFVAVPKVQGTFSVRAAYAPTRKATVIDTSIYEMHHETIKNGALFKLKQSVGHPWSDPAAAQAYATSFVAGIRAATVARNIDKSRAALSVPFSRFL